MNALIRVSTYFSKMQYTLPIMCPGTLDFRLRPSGKFYIEIGSHHAEMTAPVLLYAVWVHVPPNFLKFYQTSCLVEVSRYTFMGGQAWQTAFSITILSYSST